MSEREQIRELINKSGLRASRRNAALRLLDLWPEQPTQISERAMFEALQVGTKVTARRSVRAMEKAGIPIRLTFKAGQITLHFIPRLAPDQTITADPLMVCSTSKKYQPDHKDEKQTISTPLMVSLVEKTNRPDHKEPKTDHKPLKQTISAAGLRSARLQKNKKQTIRRLKQTISPAALRSLDIKSDHKEPKTDHKPLKQTISVSHSLYSQLVSNIYTNPDPNDPKLTNYKEEEESAENGDSSAPPFSAIVDPGIFTPPRDKAEQLCGFRHLTHPLIGIDSKTAKRLGDQFSVETIRRACQKYQAGDKGKPFRSAGILISWLDEIKEGTYRLPPLEPAYLKSDVCQDCPTPAEIADRQKEEEERESLLQQDEKIEKEIRARERVLAKEKARKDKERREQLETMRQGEGDPEAGRIWREEIEQLEADAKGSQQAKAVLALVNESDVLGWNDGTLIVASGPQVDPVMASRAGRQMAVAMRARGQAVKSIEFR